MHDQRSVIPFLYHLDHAVVRRVIHIFIVCFIDDHNHVLVVIRMKSGCFFMHFPDKFLDLRAVDVSSGRIVRVHDHDKLCFLRDRLIHSVEVKVIVRCQRDLDSLTAIVIDHIRE